MTAPSFTVSRASRTAEAIESLRARLGDEHADMVGSAAVMLMQIRSLHAIAHCKDIPKEVDREAALCAGFEVMAQNLGRLMVAAKIDQDDVAMLLPLLMKDVDDAVAEVRSRRATKGGGLH